jgi:hypothetical protein
MSAESDTDDTAVQVLTIAASRQTIPAVFVYQCIPLS